MSKCYFKKSHLVAWVFSCKFAAYFQNNFSQEQLWVTASGKYKNKFQHQNCKPILKYTSVKKT